MISLEVFFFFDRPLIFHISIFFILIFQDHHQNPMRKNHLPAQALAPAPLPTPTPTPPPPLLSSFLQMKHHLHTLSRRYHQTKKSCQLRLNQPPQLILQPLCLSKMTSSPLKPRAKMTHRVHPHRPTPPTKRLPTIAHHLRMKSQIQQRHLRLLET